MRVGVPKEVKSDEYRVGMMPVGAATLVKGGTSGIYRGQCRHWPAGFQMKITSRLAATIVQTAAGDLRQGRDDREGEGAAAERNCHVSAGADRVHLFPFRGGAGLGQGCLESGIVAIAYETIKDKAGPASAA